MMIIKICSFGYEAYAVGELRARFDPCAQTEGLGYYNFRAPGGSEEAFRRTVDTGIEHGTVTVLLEETVMKLRHTE